LALEITFQIRLEGASKDVIVPKLKNLSYTVPFIARNVGDADSDPNFVMCVSIVPDNSAIGDRMNSLYRVPGVKQVDILQTIPLKGQRRWYGNFMIPLLISTVVFSLGVLTVLLDVVMDLL
jgi:hypothetical protein